MKRKYNWKKMTKRAQEGGPFSTVSELARYLKVPRRTVQDAYNRGDLAVDLMDQPYVPEPARQVKTRRLDPNTMEVTLETSEQLTQDEMLGLAGLDKDEWEVSWYETNMWQSARKDVHKDLEFDEGRISGYVKDTGKMNKTYLHQVKFRAERIVRRAKTVALQPIEVKASAYQIPGETSTPLQTVLFVADPHFGFLHDRGSYTPIHHRRFLSDLLFLARVTRPQVTIFNGDALDLAEMSKWDSDPAEIGGLQLAGIEAAWVMRQFANYTKGETFLLEGNHEIRLKKALWKHLSSAYGLRSVANLEGNPLLSVPSFLGLDEAGIRWVDGYPSNHVTIGDARFYHGKIVRGASGATVKAIADNASTSHFFGHTHRFGLTTKWVDDLGKQVWVGSPGCACLKGRAPGSEADHNWKVGAFLVHMLGGQVASVEYVSGSDDADGNTLFRRSVVEAEPYFDQFIEDVPQPWRDMLTD